MSEIITALAVVDELASEDGALALVESRGAHRVVRLSALGQAIRELAADGVTLGSLIAGLEARFGPAGDESMQIVTRAVAALEADGLVSRAQHKHAHG